MNQHKFAFRVGVLVLLIAVMAGVFSVRLHNVQITQAAEQDPTPSGSVTYHTRVTAARGEILDRNGNVLVGNRASYNLVIVREVLMSADAPNKNLRRLVDLCSELGLEYTDHFPVTQENPMPMSTAARPCGTAISAPSSPSAAGIRMSPPRSSSAGSRKFTICPPTGRRRSAAA